jgi:uncharacterized membrane protein
MTLPLTFPRTVRYSFSLLYLLIPSRDWESLHPTNLIMIKFAFAVAAMATVASFAMAGAADINTVSYYMHDKVKRHVIATVAKRDVEA